MRHVAVIKSSDEDCIEVDIKSWQTFNKKCRIISASGSCVYFDRHMFQILTYIVYEKD